MSCVMSASLAGAGFVGERLARSGDRRQCQLGCALRRFIELSTHLSTLRIASAILILVLAAAIAAAVKGLIQNSLGGLSYGKALANAASAVVLALGVIAVLGQLHVAENVVNALLYATLTAIVGVVIVAVGGGGIKTISQRWENVAASYDAEKPASRGPSRSRRSRRPRSRRCHPGRRGRLSRAALRGRRPPEAQPGRPVAAAAHRPPAPRIPPRGRRAAVDDSP